MRNITTADILEVFKSGEIIAKYDDDKPFLSNLMLKFVKSGPLHIVVGWDDEVSVCIVITAYWPDSLIWDHEFKKKKT